MTSPQPDEDQSFSLDDAHPMWLDPGTLGVDSTDPLRGAHQAKIFANLFPKPTLRRVGRYIILDVLGQGGMGVVLKAYDDELNRPVALKLLHADPSGNHGPRLKREAQALARLAHPNVVQVFEIGEAEGKVFVAMELVKGQTVKEWAQREPRPDWLACVKMFIQLGRGLAAAHERGLVHRDFKPDNALIDDKGRPRVLDFGLARQEDDEPPSVPSVVQRARTDKQEAQYTKIFR